jgi:hypothetical protein
LFECWELEIGGRMKRERKKKRWRRMRVREGVSKQNKKNQWGWEPEEEGMREVFRIYYIFYLFMYPLANWIGWNPLVGQALGI